MDKQTKMLLGVGAVAVAGYLIWKNQSKKSFVNLTSRSMVSPGCPCKKSSGQTFTMNGQTWELCAGVGTDGAPDKICRVVGTATQQGTLTPVGSGGGTKSRGFVGEKRGRAFVGDRSGIA